MFCDREISVRSATLSDAEQLTRWWNDGAVMAHAGFPDGVCTTIENTIVNLANTSDERRIFIIEINGSLVGEVSYVVAHDGAAKSGAKTPARFDSGKTAEIGIKICDPDYQGRGYGTRVLRLFIYNLFTIYGFDVIALDTNINNPRACRVYEKVGFKRVGIKPNAWQSPQTGEWVTAVLYEMHRRDALFPRLNVPVAQ